MANCKKCGIDTIYINEDCKTCRDRRRSKEKYHKNTKFRENIVNAYREKSNMLNSMGLCGRCGINQIKENKKSCEQCLSKVRDKIKIRMKERREKLKQQGICISCGQEKSIEGKDFCEKCLTIRRERAQERMNKLREEKKCLHCGKEKELYTSVLCKECTEKNNKYSKHKKENYHITIIKNEIRIGKKLIGNINFERVIFEYNPEINLIRIKPTDNINDGRIVRINRNYYFINVKDIKKWFNKEGKFETIYNEDDNTFFIDLNKEILSK